MLGEGSAGLSPRRTSVSREGLRGGTSDFLKSYYQKINGLEEGGGRGKTAGVVGRGKGVGTENSWDTRMCKGKVFGGSGLATQTSGESDERINTRGTERNLDHMLKIWQVSFFLWL